METGPATPRERSTKKGRRRRPFVTDRERSDARFAFLRRSAIATYSE
jgi:hypothetical protein